MEKLADELKVLKNILNDLKNNKSLYTVQDTEEINKKIKVREKLLFGVYQQVAIHFADLHDTPGRMKAKGVIRKQVNWSDSRNFFYWRIRRMLTEFDVAKALKSLDNIKYSQKIASESIKNWYLSSGGSESDWEEDKLIFNWFQDHSNQLNNFIASIRNKSLISRLREDFNKLLSAASNFSDDDKSNDFTREILQHAFADFGVNEKEKIFKNFS
jgi:acetyl-CoA carboxylase/biotin carboxylase 1